MSSRTLQQIGRHTTSLVTIAPGIQDEIGALDVLSAATELPGLKQVNQLGLGVKGVFIGGKAALGTIAGSIDELAGALVKTSDEVVERAVKSLPDDALVVRGGKNQPENFSKGSGVTLDAEGNLQGVSVNSSPGKTVQELSTNIPHGQVGVTTVGNVRAAGGDVVPSPRKLGCVHCTLQGISPEKASELMTPTKINPNKK